MEWISVKDRLPVIPTDKFGVPVLVCEYDSCYEEINPGYGLSVNQYIMYCIILSVSNIPNFYEPCGMDWIPCCDQITHWMYLPEPPKYETKLNENTNTLEFVY